MGVQGWARLGGASAAGSGKEALAPSPLSAGVCRAGPGGPRSESAGRGEGPGCPCPPGKVDPWEGPRVFSLDLAGLRGVTAPERPSPRPPPPPRPWGCPSRSVDAPPGPPGSNHPAFPPQAGLALRFKGGNSEQRSVVQGPVAKRCPMGVLAWEPGEQGPRGGCHPSIVRP